MSRRPPEANPWPTVGTVALVVVLVAGLILLVTA